ncbi:MAG: hypothetical protein Q8P02_00030 [Candidatus Micrarchaeota archaeon]|nr:hypothetical protein [Candidatus Micrarchaeota archaeon]
MTLEKTINRIDAELSEKEKRQDVVLQHTRLVIRDCAKAIRQLHTGQFKEADVLVKDLDVHVKDLQDSAGKDFYHIGQQAYQEYAEIKCLIALVHKKPLPSPEDLGLDDQSYLAGLADCVGELRRSLQLALRDDKKKEAEYFFEQMNHIYDNLMVLKYSSSLVGPLKRKQDMVRGQVEHARSEMLR